MMGIGVGGMMDGVKLGWGLVDGGREDVGGVGWGERGGDGLKEWGCQGFSIQVVNEP